MAAGRNPPHPGGQGPILPLPTEPAPLPALSHRLQAETCQLIAGVAGQTRWARLGGPLLCRPPPVTWGDPSQPRAWRGASPTPRPGPVGPPRLQQGHQPPWHWGGHSPPQLPPAMLGVGRGLGRVPGCLGGLSEGCHPTTTTHIYTLSLCASVSPCSESPKGGHRARPQDVWHPGTATVSPASWDGHRVPGLDGHCVPAGQDCHPGSGPAAWCRPWGWRAARPSPGPHAPLGQGVPSHVAGPGQSQARHPGTQRGAWGVTCACVCVHARACVHECEPGRGRARRSSGRGLLPRGDAGMLGAGLAAPTLHQAPARTRVCTPPHHHPCAQGGGSCAQGSPGSTQVSPLPTEGVPRTPAPCLSFP